MGVPQQPELRRSGRTPVDPESWEQNAVHEPGHQTLAQNDPAAPVPEDNVEGHHPDREQDKPVELGGAGHGTGRSRRKT